MPWTPFYFEGNGWFGMVDTPEDWAAVVKAYSEHHDGIGILLRANRGYENHPEVGPRFGLYGEYQGTQTLGEWATEQGMELKG